MAFEIPAVRFVQKGVVMYLVALPIEELDLCSIDRWDPTKVGKWKGYQRGLVESKIRKLAEYLERPDGVLPVTGFLNVREKGKLEFLGGRQKKASGGVLKILDYTRLWVVDMQHRLEGLRLAHSKGFIGKDFAMPVLITEGLKEIDEAAQFYIINTQSKKMGVDLTRRLLIEHDRIRDLSNVDEWEIKAVQIAIALNRKYKNNPWYGKIREPEAESSKSYIATEKSFVPSLKWLLTAPGIKNKSAGKIARFLSAMWAGLEYNFPAAFAGGRAYLIQKTPGFMPFHRLAPIIFRKYKGSTRLQVYKRLFKKLSDSGKFNFKFWDRHNLKGAKSYGTGESASANLAIALKEELGL